MTDASLFWSQLIEHAARLNGECLRDLFADDPDRFEALSARHEDMLLDLSKEKLDSAALACLIDLAAARKVPEAIHSLFSGETDNPTENRAVLHTALRWQGEESRMLDEPPALRAALRDVLPERGRMLAFAEAVRAGNVTGRGAAPIRDVVNVGIGGSDLGPAMAHRALAPWCDGPALHFVSNADGADLADTLKTLDPATTLFIIASKSFGTQETLMNARSAREWLNGASDQMVAVTRNTEAAEAFGIIPARVFCIWDWVGGRTSIWSSMGLPLAIAIGTEAFDAFLRGAHSMDRHVASAPMEENLAVLMALTGIWRRNAMGCRATGLMPYDQRLARLPAYVQQLDMESNGKQVTASGQPVSQATGALIWGEPGTNAQHSFFQLLHQGSDVIPVDFLVGAEAVDGLPGHHPVLLANCLAQSAALAFGRTETEVRAEMRANGVDAAEIDRLAPHRLFKGDRASSTLLYRRLDPETLGRLLALFEHRVFVQAVIWGINPFDQWGVELGKMLARSLAPMLETGDTEGADGSTAGLIAHLRGLNAAD